MTTFDVANINVQDVLIVAIRRADHVSIYMCTVEENMPRVRYVVIINFKRLLVNLSEYGDKSKSLHIGSSLRISLSTILCLYTDVLTILARTFDRVCLLPDTHVSLTKYLHSDST